MKTFDFEINVNFFHGKPSKIATLENFTYPEAFSIFNDLKLKYANLNYSFHEIVMYCKTFSVHKDSCTQVVNYINNEFIDSDDEPAF